MRYTYPVYKLSKKTGFLTLWDGPSLDRRTAKRVLVQREKEYSKDKFFIVRTEVK